MRRGEQVVDPRGSVPVTVALTLSLVQCMNQTSKISVVIFLYQAVQTAE